MSDRLGSVMNCCFDAAIYEGWQDFGDFDSGEVIAVMSSGLFASARFLNYLRRRLWDSHGIPSRMGSTFIPWHEEFAPFPYQKLARPLYRCVLKLADEYPDKKIILIGQSMGARASIAAYVMAESDEKLKNKISQVFALCAPVSGVSRKIWESHNNRLAEESREMLAIVDPKKIVAIQALDDELVPREHSSVPGGVNIPVDTGHDTAGDVLVEKLIPLFGRIPRRHIALAWHEEVPKIIAKHIR